MGNDSVPAQSAVEKNHSIVAASQLGGRAAVVFLHRAGQIFGVGKAALRGRLLHGHRPPQQQRPRLLQPQLRQIFHRGFAEPAVKQLPEGGLAQPRLQADLPDPQVRPAEAGFQQRQRLLEGRAVAADAVQLAEQRQKLIGQPQRPVFVAGPAALPALQDGLKQPPGAYTRIGPGDRSRK